MYKYLSSNPNKKKVLLSVNKKINEKMTKISKELFITKSDLINDLIEYVVKKSIKCKYEECDRKKVTVTVNPLLWEAFQLYADSKSYNYNSLLEEAFRKQIRNYNIRKNKFKKLLPKSKFQA